MSSLRLQCYTLILFFVTSLLALQPALAQLSPFTEEAVSRGVTYAMQAHPQSMGHLGFGSGFSDLDNDGDQDIIIIGRADGRVGIFENDGSGNFTDHTLTSGIPALTEAAGFVAFDYDGDRLVDLYFAQVGAQNLFVRNLGNLQFSDVTLAAGVTDPGPSESASAADFDGDGLLDLYVSDYTGLLPGTELRTNRLYRNRGDGTFEDVSVAQGVDDEGYSFQSVWFDYDRDGDVDLYLSNDRAFHPPHYRSNQLWRNDDGNLVNVSVGSGADVGLYSMGVACGDFDGNGFPDLYCTNIKDYEDGFNPLLLNQGDGTFVESSETAGVDNWKTSWGAIFFDFDNDTYPDLYVNNMFEPNSFFDCNGSFPCDEIGVAAAVTARTDPSFSSAIADIDADGDLDLLVNNLAGNPELFVNHEGEKRHRIRFNIEGTGGNPFAIGAGLETRVGAQTQIREIMAGGNSYLGMNEYTIHIGLDQATVVDEVGVFWPGGSPTRTLTNLPADQTWTLYPPSRLGDAGNDGEVLLDDFWVFEGCFEEPFEPGCEVMDFDGDSAVNMSDLTQFLEKFSGPLADCNENAIVDLSEIVSNPSVDLDRNGILDACPSPCELLDDDGDGTSNCTDLCPVDGKKTAPGTCGCGVTEVDLNANGITDCLSKEELVFELSELRRRVKKLRQKTSETTSAQNRKMKRVKKKILASLELLPGYSGVVVSGFQFQVVERQVDTRVRRACRLSHFRFSRRRRRAIRMLRDVLEALGA